MDEIENPDRWKQFLEAWNEDIYLQLSVYGMVVFVVLCVFIVLCWSHYGAAISSVVDPKSGWSLLSDTCPYILPQTAKQLLCKISSHSPVKPTVREYHDHQPQGML